MIGSSTTLDQDDIDHAEGEAVPAVEDTAVEAEAAPEVTEVNNLAAEDAAGETMTEEPVAAEESPAADA